jgi:hypothetical protein
MPDMQVPPLVRDYSSSSSLPLTSLASLTALVRMPMSVRRCRVNVEARGLRLREPFAACPLTRHSVAVPIRPLRTNLR